ncbi:uncharacterized protein LOC110970921 [Acanthochromis polyacanthus]|uniref:uncharacterized protein LOC110970921 n=1 Tax=Acanthochromis polyacanthus TaxID=80966 RepID=UPI0022342015|nr:uncharacterized protein LOC110970921 [Acanthochromis polyacanthus]
MDVWSLGCMMARMLTQDSLFGSNSEYWTLRRMILLLGVMPQHLINAGWRSRLFCKTMPNGLWRLKTPTEYFGSHVVYSYRTVYTFGSLDEMKMVCSETDNPAEADERRECTELLKAMLRWDEKDRITPSGILNHPFITRSYLSSSSPTSSCDEPKPSTSKFIMVKPADPENRINLTDLPDEDSYLKSSEHEDDRITPSGILNQPFITRSYLNSSSPTGSCDEPKPSTSTFIMVKPADPENRINLTGLPDEDRDLKSNEYEDSEDSSDYKDADYNDDSDLEDSKDSNDDEDTEVTEKEQRKTKKKKKNFFQRVFSWIKKSRRRSAAAVYPM